MSEIGGQKTEEKISECGIPNGHEEHAGKVDEKSRIQNPGGKTHKDCTFLLAGDYWLL